MGSNVDYFKPIPGKSFCEMLQSYKFHQWSPDGKNWVIPTYYDRHLGGSAGGFPTDGRTSLPFWGWGMNFNNNAGGCCHYTKDSRADWGRAFELLYA